MLPGLTTNQMIEMDRIMVKEYGIAIELMMENAGLRLAQAMISMKKEATFLIVAGGGNNGGGGITAARRLHAWGTKPIVWLPSKKIKEIPKKQLKRYKKIGGRVVISTEDFKRLIKEAKRNGKNCVLADAYIGYGFIGSPSKTAINVFETIKDVENIISLDVPSGLNTTTGEKFSDFTPKKTLTIAFMKKGLVENPSQLGEVEVIDIGVPLILFEKLLGLDWKEFSIEDLKTLYRNFFLNGKVKSNIIVSKGWKPITHAS